MLTLKEFTTGFNIARQQMPQISDVLGFQKFCQDKGWVAIISNVDLTCIYPTQQDYNQSKVDTITSFNQPIIIATQGVDNYQVIDGHHRYYAAVQAPGVYDISALVINQPVNQVLAAAYEFENMQREEENV